MERRALKYPNELTALLTECHSAFLSARKGLLMGRLLEDIKGLDPAKTELVELVSCIHHIGYHVKLTCLRPETDAAISSNYAPMSSIYTASFSAPEKTNSSTSA